MFRRTVFVALLVGVYLFGIGGGQDTLSSYEWNAAKQDVVESRIGAGGTANDWAWRDAA